MIESNIKDGDIHKSEKSYHFRYVKSPIEPRVHLSNRLYLTAAFISGWGVEHV